MAKWYEEYINSQCTEREKMVKIFMKMVKEFRKSGFEKEEIRLILIGNASANNLRMRYLPLEMYWLDKYWGEEA